MTRLVIFDLDGTLLDTIDDLAASTNYALRRNGYPEHELAAYRYFVGNGVAKLIERALPEAERSAQNVERLRRDFVEYYTEHSADLTKPYPGIRETVSELGRRGIVRAVASNKYQAATEKLVAHFFGEETFRVVLGQREGIAPKPDPTIVRDILSRTGFAPAETLYVGDSCVDMQTARNGGLRSRSTARLALNPIFGTRSGCIFFMQPLRVFWQTNLYRPQQSGARFLQSIRSMRRRKAPLVRPATANSRQETGRSVFRPNGGPLQSYALPTSGPAAGGRRESETRSS